MRRTERRGCCGLPLFLIAVGLGFGLLGGIILPWSLRTWIAGHLPASLASLSLPPSTPTPTPTPAPTPTPLPTPTPTPLPVQLVIPPKTRDTAKLYNGIQLRSTFEGEPGRQASLERETAASYALDLQLAIKIPTASRTAAELTHSAPTLLGALPKLGAMLEKAEVSKFYYGIYANKTELLRQNLTHLDALLPRDIFYDTDTILEIQDPDSKRRFLLIQSDMDVDSDGSDPDRLNEVDSADPSFQPLTSYKWPKRGPVPNPLLKPYHDRLDRLEADLKANPTHRNTASAIEGQRNVINQLEHNSSLIARTDPYIVLPGFMTRQPGHPFQPKLGDYAVVVAGDALYPAIFGDIGPSTQLGEASTRLAQAVDPRATPERSPVNDLKITYLVFPNSADQPPGPPDLGKIRARCQALLNEIGGSPTALHEWANLIPTPTPKPTTTPVPTPTPSPSATASPTPTPSASPSASPGVLSKSPSAA